MGWSPKEMVATISRIAVTALLCWWGKLPLSVASLVGDTAESAVNGIDGAKRQTPQQAFRGMVRRAVQKALEEVRQIHPFELPADCEKAVAENLFSIGLVPFYLAADDPEKRFQAELADLLSAHGGCDVSAVPIPQLADRILHHMKTELPESREALLLYDTLLLGHTLQILQRPEVRQEGQLPPPFNVGEAIERLTGLLQAHQEAVRLAYQGQKADPGIVPGLMCGGDVVDAFALPAWMESQGHKRVLLVGAGGTGKTSLLLALWERLLAEGQGTGCLANLVQLNRINQRDGEAAEHFLLTEAAKGFLFEGPYLTAEQLNQASALFSAAGGYRYLLLLDGFNEVAPDRQMSLVRQLNELAGCQNLRMILTSRFALGPRQLTPSFSTLSLCPLEDTQVDCYLEAHGARFPPFAGGFSMPDGLLCNPMLLTLYCKTTPLFRANANSRFYDFPQAVDGKDDLLRAFFEGLACNLYNRSGDLELLVLHLFVHQFVLPYLAFQMGEQYQCRYSDIKDGIRKLCGRVQQTPAVFYSFFQERDLELHWTRLSDRSDFPDRVRLHLLENPTVLIGNDLRGQAPGWAFLHQEYQDYCRRKYGVACLAHLLVREGYTAALPESGLMAVVSAIRKKLYRCPNLDWFRWAAREVENRAGDPLSPGVVLGVVARAGLRQMAAMGQAAEAPPEQGQEEMLCLIDCMGLQCLRVGFSNFKERYLDARDWAAAGRPPESGVQGCPNELEELAGQLDGWLRQSQLEANIDLELPTSRQLARQALPRLLVSCKGPARAYEALGCVLTHIPYEPGSFRDYLSMPKVDGYRALHAVCSLENGRRVEFVIRATKKLRRELPQKPKDAQGNFRLETATHSGP